MLISSAACGITSFALVAGPAQAAFGAPGLSHGAARVKVEAKKGPKAKLYTACFETFEYFCEGDWAIYAKTKTWQAEGYEPGTYTQSGKDYDFDYTATGEEYVGVRGKHGVITGHYSQGTFILTPVPKG